jgi:hypothetical protein
MLLLQIPPISSRRSWKLSQSLASKPLQQTQGQRTTQLLLLCLQQQKQQKQQVCLRHPLKQQLS